MVVGRRRMVSRMKRRIGYAKPSSAVMNYVKSVLNPSTLGARLPDEFAGPTSVFQLEQEYVVSAAGTNVLMALELGTLPHFWVYSGASATLVKSGNFSAAPSSFGGVDTGFPAYVGTANDLNILTHLYKACRLVSAGIKIQFSGTDANNQGILSLAYMNREWFENKEELFSFDSGATTNVHVRTSYLSPHTDNSSDKQNYWSLTSANTYENLGTKLRALPVNAFGPAKDGAMGRYVPLDQKDLQYRELISNAVVDGQTCYSKSNAFCAGTGSSTEGPLFGTPSFLKAYNEKVSSVSAIKTAVYNASPAGITTTTVNVDEMNNTNQPIDVGSIGSHCNYGAFIALAQNLGSSASFVVKVTANYEGIVLDEALNLVSTTHSPVVSGGIAKANKLISKKWQVRVGSEADQGH
jgi:hypothetical protein